MASYRGWNKQASGQMPSKFGEGPQNVKTKGPEIALDNVGSFQYLMYKRSEKKYLGPSIL